MFRTFLMLRYEYKIDRKGIFSPIIVPIGTKDVADHQIAFDLENDSYFF